MENQRDVSTAQTLFQTGMIAKIWLTGANEKESVPISFQ